MSITDNIELILPFKAEYVSIARLTASGIANRIGFDIETIEDIKVAIAEVCNKILSIGSKTAQNYSIIFKLSQEGLVVEFVCSDKSLKCIFGDENDALGVSIITALMDNIEFCTKNDYILSMSKALEGNN
ncbi:MAG: ATP-binding protein [Clostridia bacterium]|nr:ATP-binding protein [Clostridia bacterium]